ncbi:MAG: mechanosensitive ion channel [Bacteroidales bacterium]|nr:mechanosensitive ion channel [Bacteroidales bacterium]MCF8388164.1 mechanosensitive ion channel [Bacteroidales bacterium]MCF8399106.1 mechanosensitive ion channel [Bacteroidales bacterium]
MEKTQEILNYLYELITKYGLQILGSVIALIIGLWIIAKLTKVLSRTMEKKNVDESLRGFFRSFFNIALKVLLLVSIASMLGIEMTSFIAILGAATLAIGLALSGTLQNFAGGVMILLYRPFKVGDFIEGQGYMGTVNAIQIFNTILKTPDNKTIIIPNGGLSTSSIVNFSAEELRRVDWTFGIGYGDDTAKAKNTILRLINEDQRILKDPEPFVAVSELADSSVNFVVRAWAKTSDYWGIFFDMNDKIYNTFNKEGINIPFPQMDVHMHQ